MIPTFRNEIEASIYAEKAKPLQTALDTVTWYDQNGTFNSFDQGRIFVMNDSGKTISDWNLTALNVMAAERKAA